MRLRGLLLVLSLVALSAPPAEAMCAIPGIYLQRTSARPGDAVRVTVIGGRGASWCNDSPPPPGTVPPPPSEIRVRLYLSRADEQVTLARFSQRGYGHRLAVRIPAGTPLALWTVRTDTGLRAAERFRVGEPPLLPRTATSSLPLAATGAWLLVAGAYALRRAAS